MKEITPETIRRAIEYINERIDAHKKQFAREVGRHLFVDVYSSDLRIFRGNASNAAPSLEKISGGTGITARKLLQCIHFYVLECQHGRNARTLSVPDLQPWQWNRLWDLEGDGDKLVEVAAWVERQKVGQELLDSSSRLVMPYIEAGGRLEDLLVGEADEGAFRRLADMVRSWIGDGRELRPEAIDRALAILDEIEVLLGDPRIVHTR
jgi:hypothetical protein